jgi:hypothetical protein
MSAIMKIDINKFFEKYEKDVLLKKLSSGVMAEETKSHSEKL